MTTHSLPPFLSYRIVWWLLFGFGIGPFLWLAWAVIQNALGPDPAEVLMHTTGEWAIRFLVVVLLGPALAVAAASGSSSSKSSSFRRSAAEGSAWAAAFAGGSSWEFSLLDLPSRVNR